MILKYVMLTENGKNKVIVQFDENSKRISMSEIVSSGIKLQSVFVALKRSVCVCVYIYVCVSISDILQDLIVLFLFSSLPVCSVPPVMGVLPPLFAARSLSAGTIWSPRPWRLWAWRWGLTFPAPLMKKVAWNWFAREIHTTLHSTCACLWSKAGKSVL